MGLHTHILVCSRKIIASGVAFRDEARRDAFDRNDSSVSPLKDHNRQIGAPRSAMRSLTSAKTSCCVGGSGAR
jgi:hypothetical protein